MQHFKSFPLLGSTDSDSTLQKIVVVLPYVAPSWQKWFCKYIFQLWRRISNYISGLHNLNQILILNVSLPSSYTDAQYHSKSLHHVFLKMFPYFECNILQSIRPKNGFPIRNLSSFPTFISTSWQTKSVKGLKLDFPFPLIFDTHHRFE